MSKRTFIAPFPKGQPPPTCKLNLMPFHIDYTGPAAMSTFMKVEAGPSIVGAPQPPDVVSIAIKNKEVIVGDDPGISNASSTAISRATTLVDFTPPPDTANSSLVSTASHNSSTTTTTDATLAAVDGDSQTTSLAVDSQITLTETAMTTMTVDMEGHTIEPKRYVSTFRGRTIHGLDVSMPSGYIGLLLQRDEEGAMGIGHHDNDNNDGVATARSGEGGKEKMSERDRQRDLERERENREAKKKRATRSTSRRDTSAAVPIEVEADMEVDVDMDDAADPEGWDALGAGGDEGEGAEVDEEILDPLRVAGQFSTFTLWHPDIPVTESGDDYYKALHEWTALAAELHQTEEM